MDKEIVKNTEFIDRIKHPAALSLGALALLTGCQLTSPEDSSDGGECTSFSEEVATAPSLPKLKVELAEIYDAASFYMGVEEGGEFINPLNEKGKLIANLDLDRDDGRLIASQWHQCID